VMGLLYGEGDFEKTMEISIRCGQDSDCNPSNAAAVIGVIKGLEGIPDKWKSGLDSISDSKIIFTDYSFNSAVENTLKYAKHLIHENGGIVTDDEVTIKVQKPEAPPLEVAFPNVVPDYKVSVFEGEEWNWKGDWEVLEVKQRETGKTVVSAKYSDKPGAEVSFTFNGTGVVITGDWRKDGGKADVYIDGKLHRNIDTYYFWADEEKSNMFLWHILNLEAGNHTARLVVTGQKKPEATGTRIYLRGATVFKTGVKKNEIVKLSFEK